MTIAAIDIGTNTVLYSLFSVSGKGSLKELYFRRDMPRLGSRLAGGRRSRIAGESYRLLSRILGGNIAHARKNGAEHILIAATNPLRLAVNGPAVRKRLQADLKCPVEIVSPVREGYLSFLGAAGRPDSGLPALVIDLGGGSTEFIAYRGGGRRLFHSLPEGAVSLTERFETEGKIDSVDFPVYERYLGQYDGKLKAIKPYAASGVVLVGGTSSTLALLKDDGFVGRSNGLILTRKEIDRFTRLWTETSLTGRRRLLGPERKRAEVIFAGTFWLRYLYKALALGKARATPRGLRHGLALDFLKHGPFRA
jgi:exopolyphosphatase / guanosine-5'-triphosphate,3'-diphosphate pyrophosphatase